jgi:hypothetical protein
LTARAIFIFLMRAMIWLMEISSNSGVNEPNQ